MQRNQTITRFQTLKEIFINPINMQEVNFSGVSIVEIDQWNVKNKWTSFMMTIR
jgi:hypothetical protein